MRLLIYPVFGDLMLYGVAAMGWLFILGLIANVWWEKRQARLVRLQALGQLRPKRAARTSLRKWRTWSLLIAVISVAIVLLVQIRKESASQEQNSNDTTPLATWIDHYKGKMPFSTLTVEGTVEQVFTNLLDEPVLRARSLDLTVDTNLFTSQDYTQADKPFPILEPPRSHVTTGILKTNRKPYQVGIPAHRIM